MMPRTLTRALHHSRHLRRGGAAPASHGLQLPIPRTSSLFLEIARLLYDGPWVAERTAALREVVEGRPDILHPVTRTILEGGLTRRTVDAFDAFHRLAEARRAAAELFTHYEALVLPTAPFCPTLAEVAADPIGVNSRLGTFTNFVNLCDLAAIAVPSGFDSKGMPSRRNAASGRPGPRVGLRRSRMRMHRAATDRVGATRVSLPPAAAAGCTGRRRRPRCSASARTCPVCR